MLLERLRPGTMLVSLVPEQDEQATSMLAGVDRQFPPSLVAEAISRLLSAFRGKTMQFYPFSLALILGMHRK